jgi:hypothetical protein
MKRALTITGAAASLTLIGAATLIPPAGASGSFIIGTATGIAQAFALAPRTGGFAYTVTGGSSIADYRGTLAQAESQSADLGLIGTSLTAEGCDGSAPTVSPDQLPQPLIAESDKGNTSKSADQTGISQSGVLAVGGHETVAVTTTPSSNASFDGGNLTIPGVVQATGLTTSAAAKLIPGQARTASADSAVGRLSLLGGVVVLDGLHWSADQRSGSGAYARGAFTAGDVIVNGQKQSGSADQLATVLTALNSVLAPSGLHVTLPVTKKTSSGITVTPLTIGIDDSTLGASIVNPVLTASQPVQEQIQNILYGISCKFGTAFTVEDIGLSAVDGTGGADLVFGGVSAASDGNSYANPFGNISLGSSSASTALGGSAAVPGITSTTPGGLGGAAAPPATAGVGAVPGTSPQLAGNSRTTSSCATTSPANWPHCSDGNALVVGLLGLAAVTAIGGGDWLATRRRRRLPQLEI